MPCHKHSRRAIHTADDCDQMAFLTSNVGKFVQFLANHAHSPHNPKERRQNKPTFFHRMIPLRLTFIEQQ